MTCSYLAFDLVICHNQFMSVTISKLLLLLASMVATMGHGVLGFRNQCGPFGLVGGVIAGQHNRAMYPGVPPAIPTGPASFLPQQPGPRLAGGCYAHPLQPQHIEQPYAQQAALVYQQHFVPPLSPPPNPMVAVASLESQVQELNQMLNSAINLARAVDCENRVRIDDNTEQIKALERGIGEINHHLRALTEGRVAALEEELRALKEAVDMRLSDRATVVQFSSSITPSSQAKPPSAAMNRVAELRGLPGRWRRNTRQTKVTESTRL